MLTHQTSRNKHLAKLLMLPMLTVFFTCCTKSMYTASNHPVRSGGIATYKGNSFDFGPAGKTGQTVITFNEGPLKGQSANLSNGDSIALKMNGATIYSVGEVDAKPIITGGYKNLREFVLKNMSDELGKLDDGNYKLHMNNVVIDETGKVVFYEYGGFTRGRTAEEMGINTSSSAPISAAGAMSIQKTPNSEAPLSTSMESLLDHKAYNLLQAAPNYTPATKVGKPVAVRLPAMFFNNYFRISNHQILEFNIQTQTFQPI